MKKSDITYQEKLNELRLDISHPNSNGINFIFVEGDADIRLFRKFFDLKKCKVENIPGGNDKVEKCVDTLVKIYPFIVGIRDSDFLRLETIEYNIKNVFLTDYHDIEMTMLNHEPILNALVFEYSKIPQHDHVNFMNSLIGSIEMLGYLKWLNHLENLELNFSAGFQDLISFTNQSMDIDQYIDRTLSKSLNAKIKSKEVLLEKIKNLKNGNPDLLQLTNGHDLLNVFSKYFREVEGRGGTSGESLATSIRMLFNREAFKLTNLFVSLEQWQLANSTQLF